MKWFFILFHNRTSRTNVCICIIRTFVLKCKHYLKKIKNTGELGEIKGVNLPGVSVGLPALAEKDIADLKFGCEKGVDFVAASFIRKASDVAEVRRVLDENEQIILVVRSVLSLKRQ